MIPAGLRMLELLYFHKYVSLYTQTWDTGIIIKLINR